MPKITGPVAKTICDLCDAVQNVDLQISGLHKAKTVSVGIMTANNQPIVSYGGLSASGSLAKSVIFETRVSLIAKRKGLCERIIALGGTPPDMPEVK